MSSLAGVIQDAMAADARMGLKTNVGNLKVASLSVGAAGSEEQVPAGLSGGASSISFAAAAGGANVSEVTITVRDAAGNAIAKPFILDVWLSDAATGIGLTGTTASGTVQAKAASGTDLQAVTAKKHLRVQTLATGIYILEITDSAKTAFYACAALPTTGEVQVSAVLATGNYGT